MRCEHAEVGEGGDYVVIAFKPVSTMIDICDVVSFMDVISLVFNYTNEFIRVVADCDDNIRIDVFGILDSVG